MLWVVDMWPHKQEVPADDPNQEQDEQADPGDEADAPPRD
jgi:hypothetical protein